MKKRIISGIKPTNSITLGNYLGALKKWVELQDHNDCIFLSVDLHSITTLHAPEELHKNTIFSLAAYLACGIDPQKSTIAIQSQVPAHAEVQWLLSCISHLGELSRMTQFKDKTQKSGSAIPFGLLCYPVLMAADILLYDVDLVPVGEDQTQHLELTRDLAQRVNHNFKSKIFKIPQAVIPEVGARIMDLQNPGQKMSKSESAHLGAIYLNDTDENILKKFKKATTDSGTCIEESDLENQSKPGVQNLLTILAAQENTTPKKVLERFVGKQYGFLKIEAAERTIESLRPIRIKIHDYLQDPAQLLKITNEGREKALEIATPVRNRLFDAFGFVNRKSFDRITL